MDFLKLVKSRRSIHDFKTKKVNEEDLFYILESARWAPSAGNSQPWRFVVVRDKEVRKKFVFPCYNQKWVAQAPVLIVVCSNNEVERQFPKYGQLLEGHSIGAVIQTMLLSAESKGIGSCWVAISAENSIKKTLEIKNEKVHAVIALGYTRRKPYAPAPRLDSNALFYFDKWNEKETDYEMNKVGDTSKPLLAKKPVKKVIKKAKDTRDKYLRNKFGLGK
jgi:nitroreductase